MAVLGARAAIDWALPTGIDADTIVKWQLRSNMTPTQVIAMAAARIGAVNSALFARYSGLLSLTDELFAYYRQGSVTETMTPLKSEFKKAEPIRGQNIGHMYPLDDYEDAVAWTPIYLRDATRRQMEADLDEITDRWAARINNQFWDRALSNAERTIGSAGFSVPWANGTAGNVDYVPPAFDGTTFAAAHSHFNFYDADTVTLATALATDVAELREHGFTGRLQMFISDDDRDAWAALGGFVDLIPGDVAVAPGGNTGSPIYVKTGEQTGIPGELIGLYKVPARGFVEVYVHNTVPANYYFLTKSFGAGSSSNGIAVREHPSAGFGLRTEAVVTNWLNPELDSLQFMATHGFGVANRLNGVATYRASAAAAYVDPNIL